mmetsp:Transcript_40527/g.125193  ORF Transcript_40527/g.125193 Transcript_40527/m.125193 type:complete len:247 (+) Transcript_40527:136-876(+)
MRRTEPQHLARCRAALRCLQHRAQLVAFAQEAFVVEAARPLRRHVAVCAIPAHDADGDNDEHRDAERRNEEQEKLRLAAGPRRVHAAVALVVRHGRRRVDRGHGGDAPLLLLATRQRQQRERQRRAARAEEHDPSRIAGDVDAHVASGDVEALFNVPLQRHRVLCVVQRDGDDGRRRRPRRRRRYRRRSGSCRRRRGRSCGRCCWCQGRRGRPCGGGGHGRRHRDVSSGRSVGGVERTGRVRGRGG